MLTRMKSPSPSLFRKGTPSPRSPYDDSCPPTPAWGNLPPLDSTTKNTSFDSVALAQIAWTAYQNCTRRMNGACIVNRSLCKEEQRKWWTESSRICLNAILLHRATIDKQTSIETERQLAALENAYHIVQGMLESLSIEQSIPLGTTSESSRSASVSTSSSDRSVSISTSSSMLFDDELVPEKPQKQRLALSTMVERVIGLVSPKEQKIEIQKMDCPDAMLY